MAYESFLIGARMARNLAAKCLEEAETADPARAFYLIAEHDRHIDRAEDYEMRASWCAPKIPQEIAA
ncbi:hypothetical protein [Shinella sp.]|uniref:hypothetical protein n=1 Tax=Shinella sp. TaxID=1870904 RepID=UPI0029AFFF0B|nr:hypothetical protein [Shinella sp.]MDX3973250.1 hypothetical protein [Shinella sp.]